MKNWKSLIGIATAVTLGAAFLPKTAATEPSRKIAQASGTREVKVYFPKMPDSNRDLDYVEPVTRTTDRIDVAEFAIEQLIAGPTTWERERGFLAPIDVNDFRGESNCGGENFQVVISNGVAKLQFCRTLVTGGIGDDARVTSSIENTLNQFNTVDSALLLDQYGDCFKDLSGQNLCYDDIDKVVWHSIPGTKATPEGQPWKIGLTNMVRNDDVISFGLHANSKYVRYSANCNANVMSRVRIGDVKNGKIVDTFPWEENYYEPGNPYLQKALDYACSHSYE